MCQPVALGSCPLKHVSSGPRYTIPHLLRLYTLHRSQQSFTSTSYSSPHYMNVPAGGTGLLPTQACVFLSPLYNPSPPPPLYLAPLSTILHLHLLFKSSQYERASRWHWPLAHSSMCLPVLAIQSLTSSASIPCTALNNPSPPPPIQVLTI